VTTIIKMTFKPLAQLLLVSGIVAGLAIASPSPAAVTIYKTESSPTDTVKGAMLDLIQVLDDETLKQPGQAEKRRHKIEDVIKHRMDYEEMARRALGSPWSTLTPRDQREFVGLFVQLLRDAFACRMAERSDEQVVFLGEVQEDAFAEVKAQMQGRKIDTPVDFRLVRHAQEWRVYDVVIDGASIVSNYRSQFTSIIRDVSYAGLVKKMKQKAIAVKFFENSPVP
jgi:phospholipid transport system substrate-binding protein